MIETLLLLWGLRRGFSAPPSQRAKVDDPVRRPGNSQDAVEKSINGNPTWRESRDAKDLAFALETAEDKEALAFADSIEAQYFEELENPEYVFDQSTGDGFGVASLSSGEEPADPAVLDTGWLPARDARPSRGWHPAVRAVAVTTPLSDEDKLKLDELVRDFVGQEPGKPMERASFFGACPRGTAPLVEEQLALGRTVYYYEAYCDSSD